MIRTDLDALASFHAEDSTITIDGRDPVEARAAVRAIRSG